MSAAESNGGPRPPDPTEATPWFHELYDELRGMARRYLADERAGHSLQATALVHEAWLRMREQPPSESATFLRAAARAMRQILIDHARGRARIKRGRDFQRLSLDAVQLVNTGRLSELLAIDEALVRLSQWDDTAAECVRLRLYAGLSVEAAARVLGISERTAYREWAYAKAFLFRLLAAEPPDPDVAGGAGIAPGADAVGGERNGTSRG